MENTLNLHKHHHLTFFLELIGFTVQTLEIKNFCVFLFLNRESCVQFTCFITYEQTIRLIMPFYLLAFISIKKQCFQSIIISILYFWFLIQDNIYVICVIIYWSLIVFIGDMCVNINDLWSLQLGYCITCFNVYIMTIEWYTHFTGSIVKIH